jgi:hypothetical protein
MTDIDFIFPTLAWDPRKVTVTIVTEYMISDEFEYNHLKEVVSDGINELTGDIYSDDHDGMIHGKLVKTTVTTG